MSSVTLAEAVRPKLPALPATAGGDNVWKDADGVLREHDYELPVDKKTRQINGRVFACQALDCSIAEWVIAPATEPKAKYCKNDGIMLTEIPLHPDDNDPIAAGRQRQLARLAGWAAGKRQEKADKIREAAHRKAEEARQAAGNLATDMRGHVPSLAATAVIEIGVIYTVDLTGPLEAVALAAAIGTWAAVTGYFLATWFEKQRLSFLARRKEKAGKDSMGPTKISRRATERGIYTAKALIGTGTMFACLGVLDAAAGMDLTNPLQGGFVAALAIALGWAVNSDHWSRLWKHRQWLRDEAAREVRAAAEAEARRLEEDAARRLEEQRLREQEAVLVDLDLNTAEGQGKRMELEWNRMKALETAKTGFPRIGATRIVPEKTRPITVPDPETGDLIQLGWEFTGVCEPGALITGGGMVPPIIAAKEWIVSVLDEGRYDPAAISLIDVPDGAQNTFLLMVTEKSRLGDAVPWRSDRSVRVDHNGIRYGYLGRSLTGDELEEVLYAPTQPFGGVITGTTGGGKGGFLMRYLLNCLKANILPVLFDPKGLVDYGDFAGVFPIGFTRRHRRIIMESLHAERRRRESRVASAPKVNRYGATVAGESRWQTHDNDGNIGVFGEPIASCFDEFHDLIKEPSFVDDLTNHVRFQRAAGMGAILASQGGGLEDWGSSVLRDLGGQTSLTNFRGGEMQSRMSGNRNGKYSTADLPNLPGMCLRRAPGSPDVPLRAAFITRDPQAEDTVYTTLWGKGSEPVLQIPNPMDWVSEETKQLWKSTGLWQLWELAQGPGGLERLLADVHEDEEDEDDERVSAAGGAMAVPMPKELEPARMTARDVLLAILHESPGLDRDDIVAHDAWLRAPGWGRQPDEATVTRVARDLDPTSGGTKPLPAGRVQKLDRGPKSTSWRLTPAGAQDGVEQARRLALRTPQQPAPPVASSRPGLNPAAVADMQAQQQAELARMLATEARMAAQYGGGF